MVKAILEGGLLPPIIAFRSDEGGIQIADGHHRACAYWLSGRNSLGWGEVLVLEDYQHWKPAKGMLVELVKRQFG